MGVELPLLPTIAFGALPGAPDWAAALERIGLDVVCSGAAHDTPETWRAAREAVAYRPVKARSDQPGPLIAAGCLLIESDVAEVGPRAYRLGSDETVVAVVDGASPEVEDPAAIARPIVEAARAGDAAALWVAATPGLDGLPRDVAEAKLAAMVEAAIQARLALAKDQFEL
jgi:methionine synthase II (cobalamin-independent)